MSILRIIGAVIGWLLLVVCGGVALVTFVANPSMSDEGQVLGTISLVLLAALGFFLVRRSSPTLLGKVTAWPVRFVGWLLQRSVVWHPIGLAVWTLLIALWLLALAPRNGVRLLVSLGAFLVYFVVAMIGLAIRPRWWVRALQTLLLVPVVMAALISMAEAFEPKVIGEGALAFIGPLIWSWAVIPLTGLVRLVVGRPAAPPVDRSGQPS